MALYSGVGTEFTHYEVDVDGASADQARLGEASRRHRNMPGRIRRGNSCT